MTNIKSGAIQNIQLLGSLKAEMLSVDNEYCLRVNTPLPIKL